MIKRLDSSVGKRRGLHSPKYWNWFPTSIFRSIAEFTKHNQHGPRREIRQVKEQNLLHSHCRHLQPGRRRTVADMRLHNVNVVTRFRVV